MNKAAGVKIRVGIVQINNSFSGQNYLPYSVGLLQGYAEEYLSDRESFEFLLPVYQRAPVEDIVKRLDSADIIFFSTYVWNFRISLEIARRIKDKHPQAIIVFGGPEVPIERTEEFLRRHQCIDIACYGEGEDAFLSLLENCRSRDWQRVPSIVYTVGRGRFIRTHTVDRMTQLDKVPSPYLKGVFEPLMEANPKEQWIALWETNRGCPFACTYCVWGSSSQNKVYAHSLEKLYGEMDWFSRKKIEFIFCCDANFGILERDIKIVEHLAENKRRYGYPQAFSVQSTKNFTEHSYRIYETMSGAGLSKGVSLSLQSLNTDTLRDTRRKNIPIESFKEIQERLTASRIETFTDIILGLPNETYESFVAGVSAVIENGQHNRIQFNNLSILTNSEMDEPEYRRKFGFETVETKLINIHGSLSSDSQIEEMQRLVVGTSTMPREDWVRARVFGWMAALLYFDKLLQVPFIILHKTYTLAWRELLGAFINITKESPVLYYIHSFFTEKAVDIQNGGAEFCQSKRWLNIWWPADELVLINLCTENKLKDFYKEAEAALGDFLKAKGISGYEDILGESVMLNRNLIKMPFQKKDLRMELNYNIWEVYHAALRGINIRLKNGQYSYKIGRATVRFPSWEDWCREVVWYGNKKGAYIYDVK